jgi:hypothetical protein
LKKIGSLEILTEKEGCKKKISVDAILMKEKNHYHITPSFSKFRLPIFFKIPGTMRRNLGNISYKFQLNHPSGS